MTGLLVAVALVLASIAARMPKEEWWLSGLVVGIAAICLIVAMRRIVKEAR